jgi:hypothetical protein
MLFRLKTIDDANIHVQHLERDKWKQQKNTQKKVEP